MAVIAIAAISLPAAPSQSASKAKTATTRKGKAATTKAPATTTKPTTQSTTAGTQTTQPSAASTQPTTAATTPGERPVTGGILTFGQFFEPAGLDPIVSTGHMTTGFIEMAAVYDTLVRYPVTGGTWIVNHQGPPTISFQP